MKNFYYLTSGSWPESRKKQIVESELVDSEVVPPQVAPSVPTVESTYLHAPVAKGHGLPRNDLSH